MASLTFAMLEGMSHVLGIWAARWRYEAGRGFGSVVNGCDEEGWERAWESGKSVV